MAPVRRYLRISKYSVLECRIYLDNPALAQTWLLRPRDPILLRVIEAVRPFIFPKLREERERSKKKSSKKKQIKDVIVEDDFEVSMFLTETSTRHSLLTKHKHFRERVPGRLQSTSTRLTGEATTRGPTDLAAGNEPIILEEQSDDGDDVQLADIPQAQPADNAIKRSSTSSTSPDDAEIGEGGQPGAAIELDSDEEQTTATGPRAQGFSTNDLSDDEDDKKKLALDVTYEGFAIYGRVLCLVVKKKDPRLTHSSGAASAGNKAVGQAKMENWISSTQVPVGGDVS